MPKHSGWESRHKEWFNPEFPKNWTAVVHEWGRYWNTSKSIWLEKSPPHIGKVSKIYDQLKDVYNLNFIFLTRSPCYMSNGANTRYVENQTKQLLDQLDHFYLMKQSMNYLSQNNGNFIHVRYENLVKHPNRTIDAIRKWMPELADIDGFVSASTGKANHGDRSKPLMSYISKKDFTHKMKLEYIPSEMHVIMEEINRMEKKK